MQLLNPHSTRSSDDAPEIGDIVVCGSCRLPSVVELLGTRLLTEDEIASAPPEVSTELHFALRALREKLSQS